MTKEPDQPGSIWQDALDNVDLSGLGQGKEVEYPTIQPDEISGAFERDSVEGILMRMANDQNRRIRDQAEGKVAREKGYHPLGWRLNIQTPDAVIGLWSCWVGDQLSISYPKGIISGNTADRLTTEILEVEHARPVRVSKNKAGEETSEEGITDPEAFLRERDPYKLLDGVYTRRSRAMFGRYYGSIEPTGGRVWIDRHGSHTKSFKYAQNGELKQTDFWTRNAEAIFTFPNQLYGNFAPEGPTIEEQAIQSYRDKFILLAAKIACEAGGPMALDICFDFTQLVPEDLYREGYEDIKWIKGDLGEREGFGQDLVRGSKGSSIVYLESAGDLVPWSTIVHTPMTKIFSARVLTDFIKEDFLWF